MVDPPPAAAASHFHRAFRAPHRWWHPNRREDRRVLRNVPDGARWASALSSGDGVMLVTDCVRVLVRRIRKDRRGLSDGWHLAFVRHRMDGAE
ncbi:hypothetical protein TRIP_B330653 [uncultured Desulfatiglans sp.]|nr:hypothetical protein TRIP_B330653 [uncultured Desulfatiglans sp.]